MTGRHQNYSFSKHTKKIRFQVLCLLCRHIILSLDSPNKESNFTSLFLNKSSLPQASKLVSSLLSIAPQALDKITVVLILELSVSRQWQVGMFNHGSSKLYALSLLFLEIMSMEALPI